MAVFENKLVLSIGLVMLLTATPSLAQWQIDGLPVAASATAFQVSPAACEDGAGGVIVAWRDVRNGNSDIYAQRFDTNGLRVWGDGGLAVCVDPSEQYTPEIVSDGAGGAIIVWRDRRVLNYPLFAQRLNASGQALWAANGVLVGTTRTTSPLQRIVAVGDGGAIVSWLGDANPVVVPDQRSVYSQRLDENGVPLWSFPWGNAANDVDVQPLNLAVAPDGLGGVLLLWYPDVGGTSVQRLDGSGNRQLGPNGVEVYDLRGVNMSLSVSPDGGGGAFAGWSDNSGPLHVQHVTQTGDVSWAHNGIVLSGPDAMVVRSVADGQGGAIFVWGYSQIHSQRVDSLGTFPWGPDGTVVSAATDWRVLWDAASDGNGGALAVWTDKRDRPEQDIYVQRIRSDGTADWLQDGVGICKAGGYQNEPCVVGDGTGGAIAAWSDERGDFPEVYVQRVDNTGTSVPTFLESHDEFLLDNAIHVEWSILHSGATPGHTVYRAEGGGEWRRIAVNVIGNDTHFEFDDQRIQLGESYRYRVVAVDELDSRVLFETDPIETIAPAGLSARCFPNPFNPSTTIRYALPRAARVTVAIYSVDGRLIRVLERTDRRAGVHDVEWRGDGDDDRPVASGVYFYRVVAGNRGVSGRLVLLK